MHQARSRRLDVVAAHGSVDHDSDTIAVDASSLDRQLRSCSCRLRWLKFHAPHPARANPGETLEKTRLQAEPLHRLSKLSLDLVGRHSIGAINVGDATDGNIAKTHARTLVRCRMRDNPWTAAHRSGGFLGNPKASPPPRSEVPGLAKAWSTVGMADDEHGRRTQNAEDVGVSHSGRDTQPCLHNQSASRSRRIDQRDRVFFAPDRRLWMGAINLSISKRCSTSFPR